MLDREELTAWLRLQFCAGVGSAGARQLLQSFGLPQNIFEQSAASLGKVVSQRQAQSLLQSPEGLEQRVETTWKWLQAQPDRHRILTLGDANYPAALLNIEDPPVLLYAIAAPEVWQTQWLARCADHCIAIVGSRNPTPQGAHNARQFARSLAQSGLTIVSGLALGVDGAAHEGALAVTDVSPCATIAVVGTGLDRVYPKQHRDLAHQIAQRGVLLSEYALGTPPLTANFPKRNRIIAGLSRGTLVVEAALRSGSLITARQAVEQGKEIFAIPGSIHSTQARGCHALIRQGAKLVESAHDILEELQHTTPVGQAQNLPHPATLADEQVIGSEHAALLQALGFDPVGLDDLQARTGLNTPMLQAELMALELLGQVARLPGGLFQRLVQA